MLQYRRYSGDWYLKLYEDTNIRMYQIFFFYWREIEDFGGI